MPLKRCPSRDAPPEMPLKRCPSRDAPQEMPRKRCPSRDAPPEIPLQRCPSRDTPPETPPERCFRVLVWLVRTHQGGKGGNDVAWQKRGKRFFKKIKPQ
jgi:hypothetical protein